MTQPPESDARLRLETARPPREGEVHIKVQMSEHAAAQLALACSRAESWALARWDAGDEEAALAYEWLSWGARWLLNGMREEVSP